MPADPLINFLLTEETYQFSWQELFCKSQPEYWAPLLSIIYRIGKDSPQTDL